MAALSYLPPRSQLQSARTYLGNPATAHASAWTARNPNVAPDGVGWAEWVWQEVSRLQGVRGGGEKQRPGCWFYVQNYVVVILLGMIEPTDSYLVQLS